MHSPSLPYGLHDLLILSALACAFLLYLPTSRSHESSHYAVFPNLLFFHVSSVQTDSSRTWSQTPSTHDSLLIHIRDQVSHPSRTTCKIIVWYILIFKFFWTATDGPTTTVYGLNDTLAMQNPKSRHCLLSVQLTVRNTKWCLTCVQYPLFDAVLSPVPELPGFNFVFRTLFLSEH
jgi:hypothetical protein